MDTRNTNKPAHGSDNRMNVCWPKPDVTAVTRKVEAFESHRWIDKQPLFVWAEPQSKIIYDSRHGEKDFRLLKQAWKRPYIPDNSTYPEERPAKAPLAPLLCGWMQQCRVCPTLAAMAEATLFHLCRNHPFLDGNQQTAL